MHLLGYDHLNKEDEVKMFGRQKEILDSLVLRGNPMEEFLKSFRYAFEGILHAIKTERNFKFHLIAAVIVISLGLFTGFTLTEWFVVLILIGGMLALELLNSAIERIVDLMTSNDYPLAKQAKDLAAGAVYLCDYECYYWSIHFYSKMDYY